MKVRKIGTTLCLVVGVVVSMVAVVPSGVSHADSHSRVPAVEPSPNTPSVMDGSVNAIVRMGHVVVIGGTFTQVASAGSGDVLEQRYLAGYDSRTGELIPGFRPEVNGQVRALEQSEDGQSVYVGGSFTEIDGADKSSLVRLDLETGDLVSGFDFPGTNSDVRTMARHGDRLYIGGAFTHVGDSARHGLAAVNSDTGRLGEYQMPGLHGTLRGDQGAGEGSTSAIALDVTGDGRWMVVTGNFNRVGDNDRTQIAVLKLRDRAQVTTWSTRRYQPVCGPKLYTYMRDVQFSPNGEYFAVVTSGGHFRTTLCDTTTRWTTRAYGANQHPDWVARSGGDTFLSVAVTDSAVFVGGHIRWMNNPNGRGQAGPGAVPRPSLAALSPVNGLPIAWNPGRNPRGHGVAELWADDAGLLIGGDTEWIGNRRYHRPRVASFPYDGGHALPAEHQDKLPGTVYLWGSSEAGGLTDRARAVEFTGTRPQAPARLLTGEHIDAKNVRGMFVVGNTIYFGRSDGLLYRQSVNGQVLGSPEPVDPYNDPDWSEVQTGSGETYRGQVPDFYQDIPDITGMFYWNGRLYYTLRGREKLLWRQFSTDSGVVGADAHQVKRGGSDWAGARGVFRSGSTLYFAKRSGERLFRIGFDDGHPIGHSKRVLGANAHGVGWRSRGSFVYNEDAIE